MGAVLEVLKAAAARPEAWIVVPVLVIAVAQFFHGDEQLFFVGRGLKRMLRRRQDRHE